MNSALEAPEMKREPLQLRVGELHVEVTEEVKEEDQQLVPGELVSSELCTHKAQMDSYWSLGFGLQDTYQMSPHGAAALVSTAHSASPLVIERCCEF